MKLIVTDFDNTLFTDKYKENIIAAKQFQECGNKICIATGRPLYFLKPDLLDFRADFYICSDGTAIFDKDFNKIFSISIKKETAEKVVNQLKKEESVDDWFINEPFEYSKNLNGEINGILGKPNRKQESLVNNINNTYKEVHTYLSMRWINIVPNGISKKEGILRLMEIANIKYDDIITVGDNLNDIEMNNYFNSYAVKDSKPELINASKNKVDYFYEVIKKER